MPAKGFTIKTTKARRILKTINSDLIKKATELEIKIKFLIFGPGQDSKGYLTHRLAVKKMIEKDMYQKADFPEDIKDKFGNVVINEYFMMDKYDYTIILLMSIGSISEYSMFFTREKIAHKIRLFILKKHVSSKSYLNSGPIKLFKNVYKHVYVFSQRKDLLVKISKMIMDILTYKVAVKM